MNMNTSKKQEGYVVVVVAALLAASKTQAERPLRLAFTDLPPTPVWQGPVETATGQPAHPETAQPPSG